MRAEICARAAGLVKPRRLLRSSAVGAVAALALSIGVVAPARACRCAPRPLAEYFAAADFVFLGQTTSVLIEAEPPAHRVVRFDVREPFKGDPASLLHLTTALSTATCGVPVASGEVYLVFAGRRPEDARLASFDSCNGTRRFDPRNPDADPGYFDTPVSQLLERLRALGASAAEAASAPAPEPSPRPIDPRESPRSTSARSRGGSKPR